MLNHQHLGLWVFIGSRLACWYMLIPFWSKPVRTREVSRYPNSLEASQPPAIAPRTCCRTSETRRYVPSKACFCTTRLALGGQTRRRAPLSPSQLLIHSARPPAVQIMRRLVSSTQHWYLWGPWKARRCPSKGCADPSRPVRQRPAEFARMGS